jgi:hypothetical protein
MPRGEDTRNHPNRSVGRPVWENWESYLLATANRKFPNTYEQNPERFLPDLDEALGKNRPDSRNEGDK